MKKILAGIKSSFSIQGLDIYFGEAKQAASIPYVIYNFINSAPDTQRSTFTTNSEGVEIQFSIYTETAAQAFDYQSSLQDIYDDLSLIIKDYRSVRMERILSTFFLDGDNYQAVSTYKILTDKE